MLFQLRFLRRRALADSLVRVVGLPVANTGVCLIGCGLRGVNLRFKGECNGANSSEICGGIDFGSPPISRKPHTVQIGACRGIGTSFQISGFNACFRCIGEFHIHVIRRVKNSMVHLMVCDIPHLFYICRDSIATSVQGSIIIGACSLFLLHFLCNGRIRKNFIPVRRIAFKAGQTCRVLCDFCRIVRNVFRVGADIGVLDDLFGLDGVDIGLVGGDAVTQRGVRFSAGLRFGGVCCLIGRVKVRNSLLAVGGLLRNGSGVCLLCGLCAVDFGVQTGGQVSNVRFNSIQTLAPCRHILFPLNNLLVPTVDKFGKALVVFLELLNQPRQVDDGLFQVCELIVVVGRFYPVFRLSFRGQLCAFRHIALRGVAVAVMDDDSQRFILALVVPFHRVGENRDVPRTDIHRRAALERGRGTRMRVRRASVRMAAVTARRVRCARNGEIIAIAVCHSELLLSQ